MNDSPDLQRSLGHLVERLLEYSAFPKYSLERRVDIFLVPFLEAMVKEQFGAGATLVAPEFPVLAALRHKGPHVVVPTHQGDSQMKLSAHTVNVDYLFHLPGSRPRWLFVELKTDPLSFDPEQAHLYAIARLRGMTQLRKDLEFVRGKTKRREKYDTLLRAIPPSCDGEPLAIAYLAPRALKWIEDLEFPQAQEEKVLGKQKPKRTWRPQDASGAMAPKQILDYFFALEELGDYAARVDPRFAPLWSTVKKLVDGVLDATVRPGEAPPEALPLGHGMAGLDRTWVHRK